MLLFTFLDLRVLPTDSPEIQIEKELKLHKWRSEQIAQFSANQEKKTGKHLAMKTLFIYISLVMVASQSISNETIPVAYEPPETAEPLVIPDSQPRPAEYDEDVQVINKPVNKKAVVEEEGENLEPPELVPSESESESDDEEETDKYLQRFPPKSTKSTTTTSSQSSKASSETSKARKPRQRVIPKKRAGTSSCFFLYLHLFF